MVVMSDQHGKRNMEERERGAEVVSIPWVLEATARHYTGIRVSAALHAGRLACARAEIKRVSVAMLHLSAYECCLKGV